jgi:hypothetical protein
VFLVNSRLGLVCATSSCATRQGFTLVRYSFSRSYGVKLPSSLTRVTSRLRILSSPTCVGFGYGFLAHSLEAFLGGMGSPTSDLMVSHSPLGVDRQGGLPPRPSYRLTPACPTAGWATLPRPPITQSRTKKYWNINQLSIAYAFRPQLRSRLTLGGWPCPGTLGFSARGFLTPFIVTHANILSSQQSTTPHGIASIR